METQKRSREDYAKNYPVVKESEGLFGPFVVGQIVHNINGRTIINVCVKTPRSKELGATYSCPDEWPAATRFSTGELVNIQVSDGFIKKVFEAKPKPGISAADVNRKVQEEVEKVEQSDKDASKSEQTVPTSEGDADQPF